MFNNVDGQLVIEIAKGIGAMPPKAVGGTGVTNSSPAVSQSNTIKSAQTRKVAILVDNGFNYSELIQFMDAMKNAGVHEEFIKAIAEHRHWARKNQEDMVPA